MLGQRLSTDCVATSMRWNDARCRKRRSRVRTFARCSRLDVRRQWCRGRLNQRIGEGARLHSRGKRNDAVRRGAFAVGITGVELGRRRGASRATTEWSGLGCTARLCTTEWSRFGDELRKVTTEWMRKSLLSEKASTEWSPLGPLTSGHDH